MQAIAKLVTVLMLGLFLALTGCRSTQSKLATRVDKFHARCSFVSWNMRSQFGTPREACRSQAFALASRNQRELARLMETQRAPSAESLVGPWRGINKGFGAAIAGITQDVKVFRLSDCGVDGYNVMVNQVGICDLDCRGWQAQLDSQTGSPKTMGNFVGRAPSCCNDPFVLDYTLADNPICSPSRSLIDDLVVINDDLLLGRAHVKVGKLRVPVAYFVLFRDNSVAACDELQYGNSASSTPATCDELPANSTN